MMRYARVLGVFLLVYEHNNIHCRDQQRREMRRYSSGKHLELSVNPRNPSPRCVSINQRAIHHNLFLLVQKPTASSRYPMSGHGGGGGYRPSRRNGDNSTELCYRRLHGIYIPACIEEFSQATYTKYCFGTLIPF